MNSNFSRILLLLRKEKGISQKKAAQDLGISQSLLSHYEKGIRECGLMFILKTANYYDVSCDYLLGKSPDRKGATISVDELTEIDPNKEKINSKNFNIIFKKKLLFCSLSILIDILKNTDTKANELSHEVFSFLYLAIYRMFRILYRINKNNNDEMFKIKDVFANQLAQALMIKSEAMANSIASKKTKHQLNTNSSATYNFLINSKFLEENYPLNYNALLNLIKNCENEINELIQTKKST